MSELFNRLLKVHIEQSPFSEPFVIHDDDGGGGSVTVKGYFDTSVAIEDGRVSTNRVPRVVVFEKPVYRRGITKIDTPKGALKILRHTYDSAVGYVLWLG
jgi:hypothetical protein